LGWRRLHRVANPFLSGVEHSALPTRTWLGIIEAYMQFQSIQNAIDLLGPAPPTPPPQHQSPDWRPGEKLPGQLEPKLEVAWGSFHQGFWSGVAALFGPRARKDALDFSPFRDSWVQSRTPKRAVVAAALWHIAILALPISLFTVMPRRNPLLQNTEMTWKGSIDDLPLLNIARETPKEAPVPKPKAPETKPPEHAALEAPPQPVLEAFHPRQRIYTDPVHPNHPRQTLINPKAPAIPPKLQFNLPNIVQFEQVAGPAKPRLQISEDMLQKSHPKERRSATSTTAPLVDIPNMEQHVADMNLPAAQNGPARPKLELNAGAAPRVAQKTQSGDAGPAPEVGATQLTAANGAPSALIALSANPAPPAPVQPPQGNTAARIAVSPEGTPGANPGGAHTNSGAAGGKNAVGISISGGNPPANASGAKIIAPPRKLMTRPDPKGESEDMAERTGPPDFASLPPGAKPETVFAYKKVYTLNVNMPNLNSATGSWILNFSELHSENAHHSQQSADLSGPVPLQKVDPKYPQTLVNERVAGEVILYAVIRRDGSVDSIQLVRGIDQQLDANAINALRQWKFRPGAKQGTPVELEAIVHIPFRLPEYP
jgi:TonB family protein